MPFPTDRPRRLRASPALRSLVRETSLEPADFVMPLFVRPGKGQRRPISSMPGHFQYSVDELLKPVRELAAAGIPGVILFGIPDKKDSRASGAYAKDGIVQRAAAAIKDRQPDMLVIADLCFCEYTDHGHCGIVKDGKVLNDATRELAAKTAVSQAKAGADVIAPSGMMDGQVAAIRKALDSAGLEMTAILAYAAKYASAFYGPFREAAESPPKFGDRGEHGHCPEQNPARDGPGRFGRGRHRHGQARPGLPRRHRRRPPALRPAHRGLQRLGGVRDAQGRGAKRLDRREEGRA